MKIKAKKLVDHAQLPEQKTPGAAGGDLAAANHVRVWPGQHAYVRTGIALEIPEGHEGQIRPRSGLFKNSGVFAIFGTIDSDYRGEIGVQLVNLGRHVFDVEIGMRIAQLVIAPVPTVTYVEAAELTDTARGAGGFGSTGMR